MRSRASFILLVVAVACSLFFLNSFRNNSISNAQVEENDFVGQWGCAFEIVGAGGPGPLTTISQITIGSSGEVTENSRSVIKAAP